MRRLKALILISVSGSLLLLAFAQEAYAYLDPGSGSYMLQLIIGGLLGGLFAVKMYWGKIRTFIKGLFYKTKNDEKPTSTN